MTRPSWFRVRQIRYLGLDRSYAIDVSEVGLRLIQITDLRSVLGPASALGVHGGVLGAVVGYAIDRATSQDPPALSHLPPTEDETTLTPDEVESSRLIATGFLSSDKSILADWRITLVAGKKLRFVFDDTDSLGTAALLLPRLLQAKLQVNAKWNPRKRRYERE